MIDAVGRHPAVRSVRLVGSRAEGRQTPLSDWDFAVETDDFDAVAAALPGLLEPLEPLAQQWDPLGVRRCWMAMLRGPVKIDLIFDEPQAESPPWALAPEALEPIDKHFWDWTLWLAAKRAAGKHDLVASQLATLHGHLLAPLGVERAPASIGEAVAAYRAA
ncbi:MAG: nucleotidyltransferase domain-containing protein, partial [Thermoleophilia bacterium]|nr:nucleotidyltransferase domain-containing protein [Thermoleophilia bacterium]